MRALWFGRAFSTAYWQNDQSLELTRARDEAAAREQALQRELAAAKALAASSVRELDAAAQRARESETASKAAQEKLVSADLIWVA